MPDRCKICANEITEGSLRDHIIRAHDSHDRSVEQAYPSLHDELFENGSLAPTVREQRVQEPAGREPSGDTGGNTRDGRSPPERQNEPATGSRESNTKRQDGNGTRAGVRQSSGGSSVTTRGGQSKDDDKEREQTTPATGREIDRGTSKKWLFIGVGGAGNHILDAILMRRDTLVAENHTLADVWEGGIAEYLSLNTNRNEVFETYYATVDKEYSPQSIVSNCMVGHNQHAYAGAGRDWKQGQEWMEYDFGGERNAFVERWDVDRQSLGGAQAVMLIHSVTKGTGCGATPVLAENLTEMLEGSGPEDHGTGNKPILSSVVIPSADGLGDSEMVRGVLGISRLSKAVDGIIPFDNAALSSIRSDLAVDIDTEWLEKFNPRRYEDVNRLLVSFFEGFTMSSTPISYDASATNRISGDVFDVPDSIRPALQKYPVDTETSYDPAVVMVPVLGRHTEPTDRSDLDTLVRSTLLQGQFIDFEPASAWGGTFMIYGPEEKMSEISPLLLDNELKSILGSEDFLDQEGSEPGQSVDIYVDQLVVPMVDSVHLWGLIWNPRLPTLEQMYDHAEAVLSNSNSRQAKALDDNWEYVEPLFGHLGRENMG